MTSFPFPLFYLLWAFLFEQKDLRLSSTEKQLYDTLWKQANPQGSTRIGGVQAVEFLNLSGILPVSLAAVSKLSLSFVAFTIKLISNRA